MTSKKKSDFMCWAGHRWGNHLLSIHHPTSLELPHWCYRYCFSFFSFSSKTPVLQSSDPDPSTKTLYVGNLPYKANESHVRDLFAEYGQVYAVRLMKDKRTGKRRGFGFVVMAAADAKPAIAKLNEKEYMERTLKVRIANDPKHPDGGKPEQD